MWQVYSLLLKSYRQTWFSLAMVCLSLLIACAGLSAVLLINEGAKQSYTGDTSSMLLRAEYQITPLSEEQDISFDDYRLIKQMGLWSAVAIDTSRYQLYFKNQQLTQRSVQLIGIDALSLLNQNVTSHTLGKDTQTKALNNAQAQAPANDNFERLVDVGASLSLSEPKTFIHPKFAKELGFIRRSDTVYWRRTVTAAAFLY